MSTDQDSQKPDPTARLATDELELLRRLREGDRRAFAELVDRYHARLVRLALLFVSERATAEEVAQDAWLGLLRGLSGFEGRSSLKAWLFQIAANRARTRAARDAVARRRSTPRPDANEAPVPGLDEPHFSPDGEWIDPPRVGREPTPETTLANKQQCLRVRAALEQLPEPQRVVVTMRDVEGMSSEEICVALEISEANQRVLLHRGRCRIRRALLDEKEPAT